MDTRLILEGKATLEELTTLNNLGYEFVVEHGEVTNVIHD